jgi:hypothetical protein
MQNKAVFHPGEWLNRDVETLIYLQLASKGLDLNKMEPEDIKKRLVQHIDLVAGSMTWFLDDVQILKFERQMVAETVIGYTLTIARLIQVAKNIPGGH